MKEALKLEEIDGSIVRVHFLKILPIFFEAVESGEKTFEIRKKDRDFKVGDSVILCEFDPKTEEKTGRMVAKQISYIFDGGYFGVEAGTVVFSIKNPKNETKIS